MGKFISEWEEVNRENVVRVTYSRQVENTDFISKFLVSIGFTKFKFTTETKVEYEPDSFTTQPARAALKADEEAQNGL